MPPLDRQAKPVEEFRGNRQEAKGRWNTHLVGEKSHGAGEPSAAEPAEQLLGPVGEKDDAEHKPQHRQAEVVMRANEFASDADLHLRESIRRLTDISPAATLVMGVRKRNEITCLSPISRRPLAACLNGGSAGDRSQFICSRYVLCV